MQTNYVQMDERFFWNKWMLSELIDKDHNDVGTLILYERVEYIMYESFLFHSS